MLRATVCEKIIIDFEKMTFGENFAPLFENAFGLRAIVGRRGAVSSKHRELHHYFRCAASAPPAEAKLALACFQFCKG